MTGQVVVLRSDAHTPPDLGELVDWAGSERPRGEGTPGAMAHQQPRQVVDSG